MDGRGGAEETELVIRVEALEDREAVDEVVRQAFGREVEVGLVQAIRDSPGWLPALSLVAERDGRIIGHVLFSRIAIESVTSALPGLVLAPVAVAPSAQNQGVGTALVNEGLARARALGERLVVLLGHPNYYPRFGFSSARAQGIESPFPVRDEVFMALDLRPEAGPPIRGTVRYPPAFEGV